MPVGLLACVCSMDVQVPGEARITHGIFCRYSHSGCELPDAGAWNRTQAPPQEQSEL